jgi:hypothetical protein
MVSPARRGARSPADRLSVALNLLRDNVFDVMLTGRSQFDELPAVLAELAAGSRPALCHSIDYSKG